MSFVFSTYNVFLLNMIPKTLLFIQKLITLETLQVGKGKSFFLNSLLIFFSE